MKSEKAVDDDCNPARPKVSDDTPMDRYGHTSIYKTYRRKTKSDAQRIPAPLYGQQTLVPRNLKTAFSQPMRTHRSTLTSVNEDI